VKNLGVGDQNFRSFGAPRCWRLEEAFFYFYPGIVRGWVSRNSLGGRRMKKILMAVREQPGRD